MKSSLTIGEMAGRFGLATHVLRHWEARGLLAPGRVAGGQRRYGENDVIRVALILLGKQAGFGLAEIRMLLADGDPMSRRDLLQKHLDHLRERIKRDTETVEMIEEGLSCPLPFDECPHAHEHIAAYLPDGI